MLAHVTELVDALADLDDDRSATITDDAAEKTDRAMNELKASTWNRKSGLPKDVNELDDRYREILRGGRVPEVNKRRL